MASSSAHWARGEQLGGLVPHGGMLLLQHGVQRAAARLLNTGTLPTSEQPARRAVSTMHKLCPLPLPPAATPPTAPTWHAPTLWTPARSRRRSTRRCRRRRRRRWRRWWRAPPCLPPTTQRWRRSRCAAWPTHIRAFVQRSCRDDLPAVAICAGLTDLAASCAAAAAAAAAINESCHVTPRCVVCTSRNHCMSGWLLRLVLPSNLLLVPHSTMLLLRWLHAAHRPRARRRWWSG